MKKLLAAILIALVSFSLYADEITFSALIEIFALSIIKVAASFPNITYDLLADADEKREHTFPCIFISWAAMPSSPVSTAGSNIHAFSEYIQPE